MQIGTERLAPRSVRARVGRGGDRRAKRRFHGGSGEDGSDIHCGFDGGDEEGPGFHGGCGARCGPDDREMVLVGVSAR